MSGPFRLPRLPIHPQDSTRSMRMRAMRLCPVLLCPVLLCVLLCGGCNGPANSPAANTSLQSAAPQRIIAQGQILPAGGIVQLSATPGDIVAHIAVSVGEHVQQGQILLEMQSRQVADARLNTLHKRREDGAQQREQTILAAQRQLAAAELKLEQLKSKQVATQRTAELLDLAKQQVEASKQVLAKLQAISANAVTKEFVGELEVDRQRIQLAQAELDYRRQAETQQQTAEDLKWGLQAAEQERLAATEQLSAAKNSQALEILDLEIAALVEQSATSRVVAPISGVILAINVSPGESSLPGALIEMADLSNLVCEVEINDMDAPVVTAGQAATISSRALGENALKGRVAQKFNLVGRPQLRSLNPLARADYRTVTAIIDLDASSVKLAKDWLQLQVDVEIDTSSASGRETTTGRPPLSTATATQATTEAL